MYYEYMTTQYFARFFFIHLKPRVESFWGILSCCLTPFILFNFRYKKIKTYMANLFTYFSWRGPTAVVHRNESVLKSIFKMGYEEIRDRKLLGILKKDRTWLKYELHCNHCVSLTPEIVYQASGRTMTDRIHEVRIS